TSLPKTGKETGFIIAGITALVVVAIVFGTKSKELNNIFKSISVFVIAIVAVTSVNKNVYAADVNPKLIYNNRLIGQKYTLAIMLDKSDSDRKITKSELISAGSDIEDVTRDGKSIEDTETIKTGDKVKVPGYTYTAVLYGDSNADGIVCDADDLMTIINNYLGKEELVDEKRLAANLANKDDELDTDDLMQMINMYLGKLDTNLVVSPPNSAIYPNTSDDNEYLENNWTYSLESDNTILLSKYIGKDTDITVKATYSIDGTQYSTRLAESKIEDYKPESVGWICSGPFAANTSIEKVTFESTDIIGNNASYLFYHCTNLKQVIGFGGKITDMTACFEECTSLLNENGEINIPDTVTKLHMAFMNCTSMKILPSISENSKLENGYMAFDGCSSAQSGTIYLNSSVNNIVSMFNGCNMLGYYGGTGFRIYSSINTDTLEAGSAFENCGYVTNGSQGSQEHALIITNSNSSEANKAYEFFSEEIYNEKSCTLEVKIAE
ncbi:MAG: leucine-rich repeat protein, partial [Clostridia bacterium]|nr:leucine-rich repeat protein [Clostridia bacterium]